MKKYLSVYEKYKNAIVNRLYVYGTKLPSKRAIAENLGVSVITVEQALDLLRCEGYVTSTERSGYFVCYRDDTYGKNNTASENPVRPFRKEKLAVIADNVKERYPFSSYASTIRKILNDKGDLISEKSPNAGLYELREAISSYLLRNRGIDVDSERIIIGAGAEYLYGTFAELFYDKTFAIEDPCYDKIERVYSSRKIKYEKLSLSDNGIPSEILFKSKAQILHVTPFQSFPTGITTDISKKKEYLKFAKERNGYIIEDDYSSEFSITSKLADTVFAADESDRVIYINSFSKTIFPSVRAAYAVLPERLMSQYNEKTGFYSCPVPVLEQYFITEILNDGSFERHINKVRRARRAALSEK